MNFWQGKKVVLRAMEESDGGLFYEILRTQEIQRNEAEIKVPASRASCDAFAVEQAAKGNGETSPFLVIENLEGEAVGLATPSLEDSRMGVFTCGMCILPAFQRCGYASDALRVILRFYFEEMRCEKFNASVYSYNEASNAMCRRIGLVYEGRRRKTIFAGGKFYDEILYGLTSEEYFSNFV
ncbi:MAG: GNAT family N-acetyltransferase [Clostridia bacterium]|nr:GNAT family N-acetyltransferase [Clostridia bacterium]MBQ4086486.1 GNAT family N-acetyltransferase [Clostridia bacterium]